MVHLGGFVSTQALGADLLPDAGNSNGHRPEGAKVPVHRLKNGTSCITRRWFGIISLSSC